MIKKLAEPVAKVTGVFYNKDIFEPESDRDNLFNVLEFSEKLVLYKDRIPGFQREKIDEFDKWDLFVRYALDNLAGLMLGAQKDNDLFQRYITKDIIAKLKARIDEVRSNKHRPNFDKRVA